MFPLMAVDFIFTISPLFNESRIVFNLYCALVLNCRGLPFIITSMQEEILRFL